MSQLSIPVIALIATSLLVYYKFIIYPALLSPLSKIPNAHWSAPVSPLWILWTRYKRHENQSLHAAHLEEGSLIRVGPNELSCNDISGLRTVYAGGFEKGDWYSIFDNYGVPCMFSSFDSRTHSARKRMVSNTYSKSAIHSSQALARQSKVILYERLLPLLVSSSTDVGGVDIHEIWQATTMDFICAYLFGLKNGSNFLQNEGYRRHWLSLYHSRKTYTFFSQELPRFTRFMRKFNIHLVPTWVKDANQELEAWCKMCCEEATLTAESEAEEQDPANKPVVLGTLLHGIAKEEKIQGPESVLNNTSLKYPEKSVASEMLDHLAAGHETSGITLSYVSWHLSRNIPIQDALRAELLTLSSNMSLTNTNSEIPPSKELDTLPLLHAVIMETLRLQAAIPGSQPRMTPFPSCTLGTYDSIPGGVRINAQAHSIHRNPLVFPEPEKWDYKRWLDSENGYTEDQRRERDRWFWAFSSGGRMCVGSNFAMHELKLVIAAVYSNFRTHVVNDEGIEQEDGYTCGPKSNKLILRFERLE